MSCENIAFVKMVSNPFVYFEYTALKHAYWGCFRSQI